VTTVLPERPAVPSSAPRQWAFVDKVTNKARIATCMPGCEADHSMDMERPTHPEDIWCEIVGADVHMPVNTNGYAEQFRVLGVKLSGKCNTCYVRWRNRAKRAGTFEKLDVTIPLSERLRTKMVTASNGCIHWTGYITSNGYGRVNGGTGMVFAHRAAYEVFVGPIPVGAQLDHTCHNQDSDCSGGKTCLHRRCVNPEHLEAVTQTENQRRSPHTHAGRAQCVNGHPFVQDNVYVTKAGHRACKQCNREKAARRRGQDG